MTLSVEHMLQLHSKGGLFKNAQLIMFFLQTHWNFKCVVQEYPYYNDKLKLVSPQFDMTMYTDTYFFIVSITFLDIE